MTTPTIDYSNASSGLRSHLNALRGTVKQLMAAVDSDPPLPNFKARAAAIIPQVRSDLHEVTSDLDDYEAAPEGMNADAECKGLVQELREIMEAAEVVLEEIRTIMEEMD